VFFPFSEDPSPQFLSFPFPPVFHCCFVRDELISTVLFFAFYNTERSRSPTLAPHALSHTSPSEHYPPSSFTPQLRGETCFPCLCQVPPPCLPLLRFVLYRTPIHFPRPIVLLVPTPRGTPLFWLSPLLCFHFLPRFLNFPLPFLGTHPIYPSTFSPRTACAPSTSRSFPSPPPPPTCCPPQ